MRLDSQAGVHARSSEGLAALLSLSGGAVGERTIDDICGALVRAARELLDADACTLLMSSDDRRVLEVRAVDGLDVDSAAGLTTSVGENLAGMVAATGMPMRSSDVLADGRTKLAAACEACRIRSAVLVPLAVEGVVLGVLSAAFSTPRNLTDRDESVLQLLANQAATLLGKDRSSQLGSPGSEQAVDQMAALLDELGRENAAMRRAAEVREQLLGLALSDLSSGELLAAVEGLVSSPLLVVNQFGAPLTPVWPSDGAAASGVAGGSGVVPDLALLARQLQRLRGSCPGSAGEVARVPSGTDGAPWELRLLCSGGELLGALVVLAPLRLDRFHVLVLDELARVLVAELAWAQRVAEVEVKAVGNLVSSVLTAGGWGSEAVTRAALVGNDLGRPHCVCVIQPAPNASEPPSPRSVLPVARLAASRVGLQVLVGEVDGQVALLVGASERDLTHDSVRAFAEELSERLAERIGVPVGVGVSAVPADLTVGPEYLAQARQAAAVCRLRGGGGVRLFDDVQVLASLIDITNQGAVQRYVDRTIGRLIEYDCRKKMDLTRTLEVYLDCSGVVRHAAKELFLHPHSLRYRLRRIVEIQGLDLEDPMARLSAHLALKIRSLIDDD